jgi:hypothetical protein
VTASLLVADSVYSYRDLPERHTLEYAVEVEFEQLGKYRADNRTSTSYEMPARSDLTRPLAAMMNTPLGKPVFPKRIDVTVTVRKQQTTATILALELDRNVYKPGQDVKGKVTLRPFRSGRVTKDVSIRLPEDLPDGQYALTVSNGMGALTALQKEMPHRFTPRTVEQLLEAVREVARPRMDHLYVHLPLGHGGLAVKKNELEHLPASLAEILVQAAPVDSKPYQRSKVVDFPSEYVLAGSAQASFTVEKRPRRGR